MALIGVVALVVPVQPAVGEATAATLVVAVGATMGGPDNAGNATGAAGP